MSETVAPACEGSRLSDAETPFDVGMATALEEQAEETYRYGNRYMVDAWLAMLCTRGWSRPCPEIKGS